MAGWNWLTKQAYSWRFVRNVVVKTAVLFILINLVYIVLQPLPFLSKLTFYNITLPGRERLPYADNPSDSYSISLHRLEGMFASHIISSESKADDEFRVLLLGDSGVWGWLLETDQVLSACLNDGDYQAPDGRTMRVYNLGYPVTSVLKDALILEEALRYQPDAVVWLTTLQAMYVDEQLRHPIMSSNPDRAREFIMRYDLALDMAMLPDEPDFMDRTIVGQRRELADLLRHQIYGLAWWATGVDHRNPKFFEARIENLLPGDHIPTRSAITPDNFNEWLSFDVMAATVEMARMERVPVLLVNQPIFQSAGVNTELRYNDLYPRWTYDAYRQRFSTEAEAHDWHYLDLWEAVPNDQFTDYPLHYTPSATCEFAALIAPDIVGLSTLE